MASQSVTNVTQGKKTEKEKRKRQVKLISNQRHRSDVCARKTALQRRIRKKRKDGKSKTRASIADRLISSSHLRHCPPAADP